MSFPLISFGLLGIGLAACLCLFVSLKRDLHKIEMRMTKRADAAAAKLRRVESEMADLAGRLGEVEEYARLLVPPTPSRSGLNLSTRSQALRMFRRGDRPEQIAAALAIPEREVELLLKVQRMVLNLEAEETPSQR